MRVGMLLNRAYQLLHVYCDGDMLQPFAYAVW